MQHPRHLSCCTAFVVGLFCLVSCSGRKASIEVRLVRTAFNGFTYVGSFPATQYAPPPHSYKPIELPISLNPGQLYVFHYSGPLDDADFAVNGLPKRLREAGATVLEAPKNKAELPSVDPGDRAWRVVFQYDGRRGTIYNTLDVDLFERGGIEPGGNVNSFILRVDRG